MIKLWVLACLLFFRMTLKPVLTCCMSHKEETKTWPGKRGEGRLAQRISGFLLHRWIKGALLHRWIKSSFLHRWIEGSLLRGWSVLAGRDLAREERGGRFQQ